MRGADSMFEVVTDKEIIFKKIRRFLVFFGNSGRKTYENGKN